MPDRARKRFADIAAATGYRGSFGLKMAGELFLLGRLVELGVLEGEREGPQRSQGLPFDDRRNDRRVQASAQIRTDRNVRAQLNSHGIDQ